tara:strand:- start:150 stop:704 length:555 start_codon:yes stop_codon:yes gene_type:complete
MTTYGNVPVAHAIPIRSDRLTNIHIPPPIIEMEDETKNIIITAYQYSHTIKIFSLLDMFLCFISLIGTQNPGYLLSFIMIYCGYYGANKYHNLFINIYIAYNIIYVLGLISLGMYLFTHNQEDINKLSYFFIGLSCLIGIWITKICYSFKNVIQVLKDEDLLTTLRNGQYLFTTESNWNKNYLL